jgi:hypothetical protein
MARTGNATVDRESKELRFLLSEGGTTGMEIFADRCEESEDSLMNIIGRMIRLYVEGLTYVRMTKRTQADDERSKEIAAELDELQLTFGELDRTGRIEAPDIAFYSTPFGPYFLRLNCTATDLCNHPNWMTDEPIRHVALRRFKPDSEGKMILRNYRMGVMYSVHLEVARGYIRYGASNGMAGVPLARDVADCIKELLGCSLYRVEIGAFQDRLNLVKSAFLMNRSIPKGCKLIISGTEVATHG